MAPTIHSNRPIIAALILVAGAILCSGQFDRPASSYQAAATAKWEYRTTTVNALDLQRSLDQFGAESWEVISVGRYEIKLSQDSGDNYLRVTQYEVTAKRPAR